MTSLPTDDRGPSRPTRRISRGLSLIIALAVVVLAVVAYQAVGSSGRSGSPSGPAGSSAGSTNPLLNTTSNVIGRPFPTTAFQQLDGTTSSVERYRGTPLVVNFWQVNCAPCRTEMPDLEKLHLEYGSRVAFLGLNSGDGIDYARQNSPSFGVTYDIAVDPQQNIITSIGGTGLPTTVLVRADGTVARVGGPGALDPDTVRRWIDQDLLS